MGRAVLLCTLVVAACGSRSGLPIDPPSPDGTDAGPPCVPSPESCNDADDDCDGRSDEGLRFGPIGEPIVLSDRAHPSVYPGDLAVTEGGLLAVWRESFDGDRPMPSTWVRPLDASGRPVAEASVILSRPITEGPHAFPSTGGRVALVYCGRFGADDFTTSVFVDGRGRPLGEDVLRSPDDRNACGANAPDVLFTGRRHLFAWAGNRFGDTERFPAVLDVAGDDGRSLGARVLDGLADLGSPPRLALGGGRAAIVFEVRPRLDDPTVSELRFQALDLDGGDHGPRVPIAWPSEMAGQFQQAAIAGGADGSFLVLSAANSEPGLVRGRYDADGATIAPMAYVAGVVPDRRFQGLDLVARGGGYVAVGAYYGPMMDERLEVFVLDATGRIEDSFEIRSEGGTFDAWPSVVARGGRVFVLYGAGFDDRSEVRILPLGCM